MAYTAKVLLLIALSSVAEAYRKWPVIAVGQVTCNGRSMPCAFLRLMDRDPGVDDKMGSSRTNKKGYFTVSGSGRDPFGGKPEPYIRVEYSYWGENGIMKVTTRLKKVRTASSRVRRYRRRIVFGTFNIRGKHCEAYVQFYEAMRDFRLRAQAPLPYETLYIRTGVFLSPHVPYATTNVIRIPRRYPQITFTMAKHQLAQTVRHSYDGNLAHFLRDVIKYRYTRTHWCSKNTNNGFAFNEGWAEYWADECHGQYGHPNIYTIEGNVANALRELQRKCHGSHGEGKMVKVLSNRKSKGRIHSFASFNYHHKQMYSCKL